MPSDQSLNQMLVQIQMKLLEEVQKLRMSTESSQGKDGSVAKPKGDGNTSMVNVPFDQVMIVDDKGDRQHFWKMLDSLKKYNTTNERTQTQQSQTSMDTLRSIKHIVEIDKKVQRLTEDQKDDNKKLNDDRNRLLNNIHKNTQKDKKAGIFERLISARAKGEGYLSSILTATTSKIKDSVDIGLKSSKTLQFLLTNKDRAYGDLAESFKISNKESKDTLKRFDDRNKKNKKNTTEELEKTQNLFQISMESFIEAFGSGSALNRLQSVIQKPNITTDKSSGIYKPLAEQSTFTDVEKEKQERTQTGSLSTMLNESRRTQNLWNHLTDPRSQSSMNVRIMDSKIKFGRNGNQPTKSDDGKGLGGLAAMAGVAGGILTAGALAGALSAVVDAFKTVKVLDELAEKNAKQNQDMRKKTTGWLNQASKEQGISANILRTNIASGYEKTKESGLIDEQGNSLSQKALMMKKQMAGFELADINMKMGEIERQTDEMNSESLPAKLQRRLMEMSGTSKTKEQLTREYKDLFDKKKNASGSIQAFDEAIQTSSVPKTTDIKMVIDKVKEVDTFTRINKTDPIVNELKNLYKMLENVYKQTLSDAQLSRNTQSDALSSLSAAQGPLTMPSTFYSSPPVDRVGTQSVVKS